MHPLCCTPPKNERMLWAGRGPFPTHPWKLDFGCDSGLGFGSILLPPPAACHMGLTIPNPPGRTCYRHTCSSAPSGWWVGLVSVAELCQGHPQDRPRATPQPAKSPPLPPGPPDPSPAAPEAAASCPVCHSGWRLAGASWRRPSPSSSRQTSGTRCARCDSLAPRPALTRSVARPVW